MEWIALIVWVAAALGGFVMLGMWLRARSPSAEAAAGPRISAPTLFAHAGLAAAGLVLWVIFLFAERSWLAWVSFAILVGVALIGFTMFAAWLQRRQRGGDSGAAAEPPEQGFPVGIVAGHGLFGAATLVLVLIAALQAGG